MEKSWKSFRQTWHLFLLFFHWPNVRNLIDAFCLNNFFAIPSGWNESILRDVNFELQIKMFELTSELYLVLIYVDNHLLKMGCFDFIFKNEFTK